MNIFIQFIKENPLVATILAAAGGAFLRQLQEYGAELVERQFIVRMRLESGNIVYRAFTLWLTHHPNVLKMRSLCADPIPGGAWDDEQTMIKVACVTPGPGLHVLRFKGRRIWISKSIHRSEHTKGSNVDYNLRAFGRDPQILRELLAEAKAFALSLEENGVQVRIGQSDGWDWRDPLPRRDPASVVLPAGVMERILGDLGSFNRDAEFYKTLNIPHRRGVLLYGPPGTGKTSTILAVASALGSRLYWLPLSAMWLDDAKLLELLSDISPGSILVLEDIDAVFAGRASGKEKKSGVTFSGLLNALDGVLSGHGRILFMTTNHVEKLDPALVRPGRVDLRVELAQPDRDQMRRLFDRFFPEDGRGELFAECVPLDTSMATLQEHLLANRRDPSGALASAQARWGLAISLEQEYEEGYVAVAG